MKLRAAAVLAAMLVVNACGGGGGPTDTGGGGGQTTGSLRGTVNDQSGAPVPNATVNLSGQASRTTTTAANGTYLFNSLAAGAYTVTVVPPNGYNLGSGSGTTNVTVTAGQQANATIIVLNKIQTGPPPLSVNVSIVDNAFQPPSIEVGVGGTVTWTNTGAVAHNATGGTIGTGTLNPGQSASEVMTTVGTFNYTCTIHPSMNGTVIVRANNP